MIFALTEQEIQDLSQTALGKKKADLVVMNTRLINVYTGEIMDNQCVSVKGRRIALVSQDVSNTIDRNTQIIDAKGKTLIPGLIDGHAHTALWFTIHEFLNHVIKGGTTTIITELMEIFPVAGYEGVIDFLNSFKRQPIKMLGTAPAMASISEAFKGCPPDVMQKLVDREDIVGLGESYWQAVFQNPDKFFHNFKTVLDKGKRLEGHSAGARGKKLSAYAAMGISSCHEPITAEETLERLRLGIYVMVREGSIRRDLEAISKIKDNHINLRRLILTTDGISPADLLAYGYMEYPVQRAIDFGFDPVTAIQMATLNVAEHFGLDHSIGGIAPGKIADMVIIPNPETITAECVISNGRIIARNGQISTPPRIHTYSQKSMDTVTLPKQLEPDDFKILVTRSKDQAQHSQKVRIIEMITDLVTRETVEELPVNNGEISIDSNKNLLKISAIDRTQNPGKKFTGFIKGFGLTSGTVACSASWDTSCIIAIGSNDADMALAVNRIHQLKGGIVICNNNKILSELALPVFGIISEMPMKDIAEHLEKINAMLEKLGVNFPNPILTLSTLTGAAIPYLRICEQGLVNLKNGETVALLKR